MRAIRSSVGILLLGAILAGEVEEGHSIHILLMLISGISLCGVALFLTDRPRLALICGVVGLLSGATVASVPMLAPVWGCRWMGGLSIAAVGLIVVYLGRRLPGGRLR
ncbi:MAG: hypothetical protein F8N37_06390 [Telmatospirillum sp.]|nr:hypothetical protein [Telmatospirillum sp.]